jgi:ribosome-associated protein
LTNKTADALLTSIQLTDLVISSLEDLKAIDIQQVDVSGQSPLTDRFVIASGTSTRHVKSMAEKLVLKAKAAGCKPLGVEGEREGEWVLVDLNDVIVHLMLPQTRAFYNLEKLWEASSHQRGSVSRSA